MTGDGIVSIPPSVYVPVLVAVIAVGGTVLGAVITWMVRLSGRLEKLEKRDKLSWLYIRSLIDHGYKHAPNVPLPEPPEGWLEE